MGGGVCGMIQTMDRAPNEHRDSQVVNTYVSYSIDEAPPDAASEPGALTTRLGQHSSIMSTQIQELIAAETKASSIVVEARACEQTTNVSSRRALLLLLCASILNRNKRITLLAVHQAMNLSRTHLFSRLIFHWWCTKQST